MKLGDALTWDLAGATVTREDHEPAQGRVGQFPPQFLHVVRARRAGIDAGHVSRRGAGAGESASGRVADAARPAVSERARDRRRRDHPSGADDHGAGRARGRVRVPVHAARRACSCCRRRSRRPRTSAGSTPRSCARWAHRRRSFAPRRSRNSWCWARSPGCSRRRARQRSVTCLSDRVFQIPFAWNPLVWLEWPRRRRGRGDARRLARHARHRAAAAARSAFASLPSAEPLLSARRGRFAATGAARPATSASAASASGSTHDCSQIEPGERFAAQRARQQRVLRRTPEPRRATAGPFSAGTCGRNGRQRDERQQQRDVGLRFLERAPARADEEHHRGHQQHERQPARPGSARTRGAEQERNADRRQRREAQRQVEAGSVSTTTAASSATTAAICRWRARAGARRGQQRLQRLRARARRRWRRARRPVPPISAAKRP